MIRYDVIVLGGGAAGLTCAIGAAKIGKKTLLIERRRLGGECTWQGCIPSKAFIASRSFSKARAISEEVYLRESPEVLAGYGIKTLIGEGVFTDSRTIKVQGEFYRADSIILATGSVPRRLAVKGADTLPALTSENFFQLETLPKSLVFIGAGAISLELSFPLAAAGVKVHLLEKEKFLPQEDEEVRTLIGQSLKERGIGLTSGAEITELESSVKGVLIRYRCGESLYRIEAERVFVSVGRSPRVEGYGLDQAGVRYSAQGVGVNAYMQTSQPHIYAAGDCVQGSRFSHSAGRQGEVITRNLAFPFIKEKFSIPSLPFIVFTNPEYSRCGLNEKEARSLYGDEVRVYKAEASSTDRAVSSGDTDFMLKVICRKGMVLGAWCTGMRAAEVLAPIQFMAGAKIPFKTFASAVQAYPGYGEVIRRLAKAALLDSLWDHPLVKLFSKKS